jgi:hypothetical protein
MIDGLLISKWHGVGAGPFDTITTSLNEDLGYVPLVTLVFSSMRNETDFSRRAR